MLSPEFNFVTVLILYLPHSFVINFETVVADSRPNLYGNSGDPDNSNLFINQIPRLPPWNGNVNLGDTAQRHIDFTQLFEVMGEPRGSRGRELSELISRPKPKCNRRIRIFNGVTRIRERGSLARFQCSHGFTLIGPTTIVCLRDQWSEPPPICVRGGCRPLKRPQNGEVRLSMGGAVAAFFCEASAKLIGNPIVFCDGLRWNGTEPICYMEPTTTTTTTTTTVATPTIQVLPEEVAVTTEVNQLSNSSLNQNGFTDVDDFSWDSNVREETSPKASQDIVPETTTDLMIRNENVETTSAQPKPSILSTSTGPHSAGEVAAVVTTTSAYIPEATVRVTEPVVISTTDLVPLGQPEISTTPGPVQVQVTTTNVPIPKVPTPTSTPNQSRIITSNYLPVKGQHEETTNGTTLRPNRVPRPTRPPRRFKIQTRRTRRPYYPRKYPKRPVIKSTTTFRPKLPKLPLDFPPRPPTFSTSTKVFVQTSTSATPTSGDDDPVISDYPIAIDRDFRSREQVEPIRPILPDMLNNDAKHTNETTYHGGHASMIGGILLFVIGLSTFLSGVILYCWRKNKGIARATPYDMDGRTLSAHDDANDDFLYLEQRDSGL